MRALILILAVVISVALSKVWTWLVLQLGPSAIVGLPVIFVGSLLIGLIVGQVAGRLMLAVAD